MTNNSRVNRVKEMMNVQAEEQILILLGKTRQ